MFFMFHQRLRPASWDNSIESLLCASMQIFPFTRCTVICLVWHTGKLIEGAQEIPVTFIAGAFISGEHRPVIVAVAGTEYKVHRPEVLEHQCQPCLGG